MLVYAIKPSNIYVDIYNSYLNYLFNSRYGAICRHHRHVDLCIVARLPGSAPRSHWPDDVNKRDVAQKQPADWPKSSSHKVGPQRKT